MEHITNETLQDLQTRISYLKAFLDLTNADAAILRGAKSLINPLIPGILNAVYTKLLSFDVTASIFVPKETDEDGRMTMAHPQIVMRKDFLRSYLARLFSTTDFSSTSPFWIYLDRVALMHTGQPAFSRRASRPRLHVEHIHMGLLLAYLMNILIDEVSVLEVGDAYKRSLLKALNKVLWVQNDLFGRHYAARTTLQNDGSNGSSDLGGCTYMDSKNDYTESGGCTYMDSKNDYTESGGCTYMDSKNDYSVLSVDFVDHGHDF